MSIALFALAIVMIVGGIASVIQGFPFVRLESGLAMVIGGATTASAGAILVGIAAVAARLKSLQRTLGSLPGLGGVEAIVSAEASPVPVGSQVASAPAVGAGKLRPSLAGLSAPTPDGTDTTPHSRQVFSAPVFVTPAADHPPQETSLKDKPPKETPPKETPWPEAGEPFLPAVVPVPEPIVVPPARLAEDPAESVYVAPSISNERTVKVTADDTLRGGRLSSEDAAPLPSVPEADAPEVETAPLRSSPTDTHVSAPEPATRPDAEPKEAARATLPVVGTYASGGNTYVMFSDGSIEAETPRGRFTFASLDELKAFVEAGGESEARGAA